MALIPLPPSSVPLSKNLNISHQSHLPPLQQLSPPPPKIGNGLFVGVVLFHGYWVLVFTNGGDGGCSSGRVLRRSEYGGGVTVFKGGYFIDVRVL